MANGNEAYAENEALMEKLRRILALTDPTKTTEGEAGVAAEMLAELLAKHNLSVADLEKRGQRSRVGVREDAHDLGKAAFTWKLDLAEQIAEFYWCHPLVRRMEKTVTFVGRPENVESLQALYGWLIEQIKGISRTERVEWMARTGEHVDPLRWQVNFGVGIVPRLRERLEAQRKKEREDDAARTAADGTGNGMSLVVVEDASKEEISDYMEEKWGRRIDGRPTKRERERTAQAQADAKMEVDDPEAYYAKYPDRTPEAKAAAKARSDAYWAEYAAREAKAQKRAEAREARGQSSGRRPRYQTEEEYRREVQGDSAKRVGAQSAGKINLSPFVSGGNRDKVKEVR